MHTLCATLSHPLVDHAQQAFDSIYTLALLLPLGKDISTLSGLL